MNNAEEAIFLLKGTGLEKVPMRQYDSEDLLQSLIEKHPELLAGDQIDPDEPVRWILIKREAGIPDGEQMGDRWSIDHLLLDQNGVPTFIETKRSSDTRIRREIVGQMLDYAANAQKYWPAKRIRSMAAVQYNGSESVDEAILKLLEFDSSEDALTEIERYWTKVEENLQSGHVRLIFVADHLPKELRRVIEFLNEQMSKAEVLGIELTQYVGSEFKALVPRVIGLTEAIRQAKPGAAPSRKHTTMKEFLSNCPDELREFFTQALAQAEERGMHIYWGTKGFSIGTVDKLGKYTSLFYGLPPGSSGRSTARVQGYVGNIGDSKLRARIRQNYMAVNGTTPQGQYTVNLDLNAGTIESANKLLEVAWDSGEILKKQRPDSG